MSAARHQPRMQKDPPFSRRRSPNRPNITSVIACSQGRTIRLRDSRGESKCKPNQRCVNAVARKGGGDFIGVVAP
jgi:hypothetical protein